MFYPGDPIEQRKKALLQRLSGQRRGAGGMGSPVGRQPGMLGRGLMFGGHPGAQGLAHRPEQSPMFAGGSLNGVEDPGGPTGLHGAPGFNVGTDIMQPGGPQQTFQAPNLGGGPMGNPAASLSPLIQHILQQYGQPPQLNLPRGLNVY
jgi:hypothetical protein